MPPHSTPKDKTPTTGEVNPFRQGVQGHRARGLAVFRRVLERDRHTCQYCGDLCDTVDHIIPYSHGGADAEANLVAACRWCNSHLNGKYFDDGVDGKRIYIAERLHLKKAWFRKRHSICGDCAKLFRPNIKGATNVLCAECYAKDEAGENGSLVPETREERRQHVSRLNKRLKHR